MAKQEFNAYSKEVFKRFTNPKHLGEIENPDGFGRVWNPNCGDIMEIYFKMDKKKGKIKDIKFKTFGCVSAIASSDALCDIAKGKTIEEAKKINNKDIIEKLKGLPVIKIHCSVLGAQGLKKAILDYESKHGKEINKKELKEIDEETENMHCSDGECERK